MTIRQPGEWHSPRPRYSNRATVGRGWPTRLGPVPASFPAILLGEWTRCEGVPRIRVTAPGRLLPLLPENLDGVTMNLCNGSAGMAPARNPLALEEALRAGFAVTAELGPPREPDPDRIRDAARRLRGHIAAVNVTDNQAATVKVSALAAATLVLQEGVTPILQVTGRDRNVMAAQSDLLGAWALGIRTVMALSGDPLGVGRYENLATHVRDLDSLRLSKLIARLNAGELLAGEQLSEPTSFRIVGAANPLIDSIERLESKVDAGVSLFQTNIVYDVERFAEWFAPVVAAGLAERAPFLVGVTPPRSTAMLRHMHDHIPGIEVDRATFDRMEGLEDSAAKAEGVAVAAEIVSRLRAVPGVGGVHLMAPGWETEAVPLVVSASGG